MNYLIGGVILIGLLYYLFSQKIISIKKIKIEFRKYKKGILGGALFGAAVPIYLKFKGVSMMAATASPGLIDQLVTAEPATMAFVKVLIVGIIVGGLIGYTLDRIF